MGIIHVCRWWFSFISHFSFDSINNIYLSHIHRNNLFMLHTRQTKPEWYPRVLSNFDCYSVVSFFFFSYSSEHIDFGKFGIQWKCYIFRKKEPPAHEWNMVNIFWCNWKSIDLNSNVKQNNIETTETLCSESVILTQPNKGGRKIYKFSNFILCTQCIWVCVCNQTFCCSYVMYLGEICVLIFVIQ